MDRQVSIWKIIWTDYLAFVCASVPILLWVLYFFLVVIGKAIPVRPQNLIVFTILSVVLFFVLLLRLQLIISVFNYGIDVKATITQVSFFRDRGTIAYVYDYHDQRYQSSAPVMKNQTTRNLFVGQSVIVMIDRNNPKRAFIRELYS
jgi:hypothetical protein